MLIKLQDVLGFAFEVGCCVEAVGNENSVSVIFHWLISFGYPDEFFPYVSDQIESNLDLALRIICLAYGADNGNIGVFLTDAMDCGYHHDINIYDKIKGYHFFS